MFAEQDSNSLIFEEKITFSGHENILACHRNTIELTKDDKLSKKGDCIVGVCSSKACNDLSASLKTYIKSGKALQFVLEAGGEIYIFSGRGHSGLGLTHPTELVLRRSDYLSERTAAISCSAAAEDIPRSMVLKLCDPKTKGSLLIKTMPFVQFDEVHWNLP